MRADLGSFSVDVGLTQRHIMKIPLICNNHHGNGVY